MKRTQQGFTLVEIAIVLVIVGLLLGGILKGQEMITQAKIKNSISDFSGVSAAYFGYLDRYRSTPGDDGGATRWTGATAGNGNRILEGKYNADCTTGAIESCLWWDHLRRSGFVAGSGQLQPSNAFNGIIGIETGNGAATPAAVLTNPAGQSFVALIACSSNLPDKVAIGLDTQMDDGDSRAGSVRGFKQTSSGNLDVATTTDTTNYEESGTNLYTLCRAF